MDIGFYLINADYSDKSNSIIKTINNMVSDHPYDNIILFNSQFNRTDNDKKFPILHLSQAKYFKGTLICFDVKSSMITKSFPAPKDQLLYIDEVVWNHDHSIPTLFWHEILMNKNIKTIAKNKQIYDLLNICWAESLAIMEEINAQELYDVIQKL